MWAAPGKRPIDEAQRTAATDGADRTREFGACRDEFSAAFERIRIVVAFAEAALSMISDRPNNPTATGMRPIPSPNSGDAEGEAGIAGHRVDADGAKQKAECRERQRRPDGALSSWLQAQGCR